MPLIRRTGAPGRPYHRRRGTGPASDLDGGDHGCDSSSVADRPQSRWRGANDSNAASRRDYAGLHRHRPHVFRKNRGSGSTSVPGQGSLTEGEASFREMWGSRASKRRTTTCGRRRAYCVPNRPRLGDLRKRHSTSWSCTGGQSIDGPISHTRRTGALRPISVERLPRACAKERSPGQDHEERIDKYPKTVSVATGHGPSRS